jgi:hypothetical protein
VRRRKRPDSGHGGHEIGAAPGRNGPGPRSRRLDKPGDNRLDRARWTGHEDAAGLADDD